MGDTALTTQLGHGRVVIVHNKAGTKVGCGVLSAKRKTRAKGVFDMKICNDGSYAKYKVNLKGDFADATELNFHLHSAYASDLEGPNAAAGTVGGSGTRGHYDPEFKCGGASSNKGSPDCSSDDYTPTCSADKTKCELGDLSGKMGPVPVKVYRGKRFNKNKTKRGWKKWSPEDTNPPLNGDFSGVTKTQTGGDFASVVFHKGPARVFGAKLTLLRIGSC